MVRRALLVLLGVLLALGAAEAGLRLHGLATGTDYRLFSRELTRSDRLPAGLLHTEGGLTVPRPGARALAVTSDFTVPYRINAFGMRDRDHLPRRPGGAAPRLLALGDSFTFGEGVPVEGTFAWLLEERLGAEVLNLGVPGYGLGQAAALYLRRLPDLDHDLVVLFWGTTLYRRRHLEPGNELIGLQRPGAYLAPDDPALHPAPWAADHSHLLSYLHFHYTVWALRRRLERDDLRTWGGADGRARRDTRRATVGNPDLDARAATLLRRLARTARAAGKRLVVVNIEPGVTFPLFDGLAGELTFIDLSEELRRAAGERSLRFRYDRHFNAGAHRLIADALAPRLAALLR